MAEKENEQYVVLARKYRPQTFEDLLGQDALVRTLTNAIKNNRLHHAYILTGIRGVGKTTTARLIARAINCIGEDGKGGPNIHPCGVCENCKAIAAGRHIDVLEFDAASKTGVDDMRDILETVRYKPTNARYKVYIIDEVHMLSKSSFNALLKTLEEPPEHVKFIFATTEIRKVPATILSRCQRFDLQRLSIDTLVTLFHKVLQAEHIEFDEEALNLVARAADGSGRDGLSMLDQSIVLGDGKVLTDAVKNMLGLADRQMSFRLFEKLLEGDVSAVLDNMHRQYVNGAAPQIIIQDLVDITHLVTKVKIVPDFINDPTVSEFDREMCKKLCATPISILSKIWQMLIKGISELQYATTPFDALEMILIRIAYSAALPSPADLLKELKKKSGLTAKNNSETSQISAAKASGMEISDGSDGFVLESPSDLVRLLTAKKQMLLLYSVKNDMSFKAFANGSMRIALSEKSDKNLVSNLRKFLEKETAVNWVIDIDYEPLGETLAFLERQELEKDKKNISEYPLVKAILNEFNGAKMETIIRKAVEEAEDEDVEAEFTAPDTNSETLEDEDN
jgi:DNA polymerase-3 subunit gamma/tau